MIDITKVFDPIKIRFYQEWLYANHLYDEGDSNLHKSLTLEAVKTHVEPLSLPKDARILDLGCGPGYFMDLMKGRGYTNMTGITLSQADIDVCKKNGHHVEMYDLSFLPQHKGYADESVDFIFLRHALEHSPYPIFSLIEYNRLLKQYGKMYIEVPAPDCERKHEWNANHYSVLGSEQLTALLVRTGFKLDYIKLVEYDVDIKEGEVTNRYREKHYSLVVTKEKPLDIK
jgi:cyclopropane fatty-acyl-phospholipid synthase-like methyltransferase